MIDLTLEINALSDRIYDLRKSQDRVIVAISGAPGSGKSTLAEELARRLNMQKCPAMVVPMDGFHLDNGILDARGFRNRKGAPETFDADGFVYLIRRLRTGLEVIAPTFDRPRDLSVAGAIEIPASCPVIIVEGNYVMLNEAPWTDLETLWDLTVHLHVPMPELRARLIQRWLSHNLSRAAATRRAESNDIPNAQRVVDHVLPCDVTFGAAGQV
ncbi:AAA family ATPase [Yoonia sp. 208BN28-4]|uniref:AAA family ATPase n=1 Tax=Yoonia sp. 208BN28-4 TaxID=3126505 RepID=UPI0030B26640